MFFLTVSRVNASWLESSGCETAETATVEMVLLNFIEFLLFFWAHKQTKEVFRFVLAS